MPYARPLLIAIYCHWCLHN